MSDTADAPFVATIKGGKGYEVPWLVVRGNTAEELADNVSALAEANLYDLVASAASLFQGAVTVTSTPAGSGEPAQVAQAATPAPARQDSAPAQQGSSYARRKASAGTGGRGGQSERLKPGVVPEPCQHGARTYREGNGARGFWSAYFCPSPKGTPGQCEPMWVDND